MSGVTDLTDLTDLTESKAEAEAEAEPKLKPKLKLRRCAKCGEKKPLSDYGSNSSTLDGLQTYCKDCRNGLHKARRERDPSHRIRHHFVTRITKQLGFGCPRDLFNRIEEYLGYSMPSLVRALDEDIREREGISLREAFAKNYHIDHIRPLSSFACTSVSDQSFRDCWAISNLRLIPAAENLAKSNKILTD